MQMCRTVRIKWYTCTADFKERFQETLCKTELKKQKKMDDVGDLNKDGLGNFFSAVEELTVGKTSNSF